MLKLRMFFYKTGVIGVLASILAACAPVDESTIVIDDAGKIHHMLHYLKDKRGENYFPKQVEPIGKKQFVFDPGAASWAAYDRAGHRVMTGGGSGGKDVCEEDGESCRTVTGSFQVFSKKGEDCRSGEYPIDAGGGAKMPYCMYFYRGFTIHAAYTVPPINSSHGCIWVLPSAAKWLNEEFITLGTRVTVLAYPD